MLIIFPITNIHISITVFYAYYTIHFFDIKCTVVKRVQHSSIFSVESRGTIVQGKQTSVLSLIKILQYL